MIVKNHLLHRDPATPVAFVKSPNVGGDLAPRFLIIHFTAGSSAASSIEHLTRSGAKASAHLVIARDGTITQLVPFNKVAWHAGVSRWEGLSGMNEYSIGIELDNAGEVSGGAGRWSSWFGRSYPDGEVIVAAHKRDGIPSGWHRYTEAQIAACIAAGEAIAAAYPLEDVLGHDDIAPDRKRDPGPAFPLAQLRARLIGRADGALPLYRCIAELNIREGAGTGFARLAQSPLAKGTKLKVEKRDGSWCFVEVLDKAGTPTLTGWVHGNYISPLG